jgi:AhpD family alkylhydroperoxidase
MARAGLKGVRENKARESGMDTRLDYNSSEILQKFGRHFNAAARIVGSAALPPGLANLVLIRVSQINGCAACLDMHTKDAEHAGETSARLNLVAAWRDAKAFTDAERAALEVAEQGTRIADGGSGVTDEAWANAAKHFDREQLGALVATIATCPVSGADRPVRVFSCPLFRRIPLVTGFSAGPTKSPGP